MDGLRHLGVGNIPHVTDGLCGLEVDHLALVPQPVVQQLHHGLPEAGVLLGELGGQTDKHDDGGGVLDGSGRAELLHHLDQRHAVVAAHLVE
jgi:hypothetical protein